MVFRSSKSTCKVTCITAAVAVLCSFPGVIGFCVSSSSLATITTHCNNQQCINNNYYVAVYHMKYDKIKSLTSLYAKEKTSKNNNDEHDNDEHDNDEQDDDNNLVTKEMFLRHMLSEDKDDNDDDYSLKESLLQQGKTKRKKRNGSQYRVLDNRDNLPFLIKVKTPDPYTNNEVMEKKARKNTKELAKGSKSKQNSKKDTSSRRHNLIGMDGVDAIASSIYKRKKDGSLDQVLGEFALDKSTNCGDIVDVGDGMEYQVQKARCLYKYAGGKKFVMTRKILEVKEVKRLLVEKEVKQLFDNDGSQSDINEGNLNLE